MIANFMTSDDEPVTSQLQLTEMTLQDFLNAMEANDQLSREYITQYQTILSNALRIIDLPFEKWTRTAILEYLDIAEQEHDERRQIYFELAMKTKKIPIDSQFKHVAFTPETKLQRLKILHYFFRYLLNQHVIPTIPIDFEKLKNEMRLLIDKDKYIKIEKHYVPFDVMSKFLHSAPNFKISLMLWLSYLQSMNLNDITTMKWNDIDFYRNEITLYKDRTKKMIKRRVKLTRLARDLLYDYIVEMRFKIPIQAIRKMMQGKSRESMDSEEQQIYDMFYNRSTDVFVLPSCDLSIVKNELVFKSKNKARYTSIRSIQSTLDRMNLTIPGCHITSRKIMASGLMERRMLNTLEDLQIFSEMKDGEMMSHLNEIRKVLRVKLATRNQDISELIKMN